LLPGCGLKQLLARAGNAYLQVLDATTLADVLSNTLTAGLFQNEPLPEPIMSNEDIKAQ
jgi:DNA-binding IscR family transcriptional regulator